MSVGIRSMMARFGRIAVCGSIATYNDSKPTLIPSIEPILVFKEIRMEGFNINRFMDRYPEALEQLSQWIKEVIPVLINIDFSVLISLIFFIII